jgi:hypothetical protein
MSVYGAPDRVRTYNLRIRSPLLYPVELRTHNRLLKHRVSKEFQTRNKWGGIWGSNPRPSEPQPDALTD